MREHGQSSVRAKLACEADELFALCRLEPQACCARMASSLAGLTPEQAEQKLKTFGRNLVPRGRQPTLLEELWGRAKNPLNALLLTLGITSYFLGDARAAI